MPHFIVISFAIIIVVMTRLDISYSLVTPEPTERSIENVEIFCERLVKLHLKKYSSSMDERTVRTALSSALKMQKKESMPSSSVDDECDPMATTIDGNRFIFDFRIRKMTTNLTARTSTQKYPYDGDTVHVTLSYEFLRPEKNFTRNQLICRWLVDVYSRNGTLKKSFPSKQLVYLEPIGVRQESVHVYYDILEKIGSGSTGVVHKCREKKTEGIFAAKTAEVPKNRKRRQAKPIYRELEVLNQLHHPNLLGLHDVFEYENQVTLIVDYLSGGQLMQKVKSSESEVLYYVRQICEAVKYLHEREISHTDLCLENILCRTNSCDEIKIIDFGFAIQVDDKIRRSPSLIRDRPEEKTKFDSYTADMWAIGDITYYLLSGTCPFLDKMSPPSAGCHDLRFHHDAFRNVSESCTDFIKRLLITNEKKRMTIHEALNHPWLRV